MIGDVARGPPWCAPVLIRIGYGSSEIVEGPTKALHLMSHRWPMERGDHYTAAVSRCKDAVDGHGSAEVARESFVSAALEAAVLA
jgi:hypothetical protein